MSKEIPTIEIEAKAKELYGVIYGGERKWSDASSWKRQYIRLVARNHILENINKYGDKHARKQDTQSILK